MAKRRRDVWECDAPLCTVHREDDGDSPEGYSGVVSTQGGSGVRREPWFACSGDHIQPAILRVCTLAHDRAWQA